MHLLKKQTLAIVFSFVSFSLSGQTSTDTSTSRLSEYSLEDLMNLKVVTSAGFFQSVSEAPSTIYFVTAQQIKERGYEQLEDVLRDVRGVDIIHLNGYAPSFIYFRGLYGAENLRTLLLIDGIRENNLAGTAELAGPAYSLHNVERIEIIWGPASALYGADALGGVINIITKKGKDINGFQYSEGFGTFNTRKRSLVFGVEKNNFDVSLSGSMFSTDGPVFKNRNPYYANSFVDNARSFNGKLSYSFDRFKTTLGYREYDTPMGLGVYLNSATKVLDLPSQGNHNSGSIGILDEDVDNEHPGINEPFSRTLYSTNEIEVNDHFKLLASFVYRETGTSDRSFLYLSIDSNITSSYDTSAFYRFPLINQSNRVKGELSGRYDLSENQMFFAGLQYYQDNLEYGNRAMIRDTNVYLIDGKKFINVYPHFLPRNYVIRNNFGSYIQYVLNTRLFHKTSFTAGLRNDNNSDFTSPVSPRLAILINPYSYLTFKLLYGHAFRSPTVTEVRTAVNNLGGKPLAPEKVITYDLNIIYTISTIYQLQLNAFYNELSDIYVLNAPLGSFQTSPSNGKANIRGVEAQVDLFSGQKFTAFLNFTYQDGRQTDLNTNTTFDIPNIPQLKGNIGTTFYVRNLFTLSGSGNWVGQRRLPSSNPYGADKNDKMDGYIIGNLVMTTRKLFNNRISASVNIRNIFNTHYLDPGIRSADGVLYSTVLEQPGRTVMFKIQLELGY